MKHFHVLITILVIFCQPPIIACGADTLRGGNGSGRAWWDVQHYQLSIFIDTASEVISGFNEITLRITAPPVDSMQLDLQRPMVLDSVLYRGEKLAIHQSGNVWWIIHPFYQWERDTDHRITAFFHGRPKTASNPPWDGGFIRTHDSLGNLWMAVACQGLGASSWWPCKDYQADKPDKGMGIQLRTNSPYPVISNGRLISHQQTGDTNEWQWQVQHPISTYNVTFYMGDYIQWHDTLIGASGRLPLSFYALRYNEAKARTHFTVVKPMLRCFEHWMGPYPFYSDGYKLVEAPYLGMEHQSAVAYGNGYKMGYKGTDRSGTGVGMAFDFIIVHESGHEWFGNNITAADVADNWIHEGFTTYTEALFAECLLHKTAAFTYARGTWQHIRNDKPVIGQYGIRDAGSGDKYDKGAAVVHMIRVLMDDDDTFRKMLRGLNQTFRHKTVSTAEVESFISQFSDRDFTPLFDQYLRTSQIPELEYFIKENQLFYRLNHAVAGFTLPLHIHDEKKAITIHPISEWQHIPWTGGYDIRYSEDFLIQRDR